MVTHAFTSGRTLPAPHLRERAHGWPESIPLPPLALLSMRSPRPFSGEQAIDEVPDFIGAPGEIRTPGPQIRSLVFDPVSPTSVTVLFMPGNYIRLRRSPFAY
jgi:hypothetical protein